MERRAYRQALFAVQDEHAALDLVQDAMLRLTEKYGARPEAELPLLFHRILQNAIRDYYRRTQVRSSAVTSWSTLAGDDEEADPLEFLPVEEARGVPTTPADQFAQSQVMAAIEEALGKLPPRQREAFLLRYWEDLDLRETAQVMGCSEGSVKTHCSRAVEALSKLLQVKGITL